MGNLKVKHSLFTSGYFHNWKTSPEKLKDSQYRRSLTGALSHKVLRSSFLVPRKDEVKTK